MELNDYQQNAISTRQKPERTSERDPIVSLLGLAGEAGQLLSEYKKYLRDGDAYKLFPARVREELGDLLWYIASTADEFGITLEEIAASNISKAAERFGGELRDGPRQFDADLPDGERFPRQLQVVLLSIPAGSEMETAKLRMLLEDGRPLGDDLTDNAYEEDGYRFHDVFHLACMAILGWSPVLRKLLGCKRRSVPKVNDVEDGGRAAVIEEGVSALVFNYALEHNHLNGITKLDYELLRTIKGMTRHLEVSACSTLDWEMTILATYQVWREVSQQRAGILRLDLDARTIKLVGNKA